MNIDITAKNIKDFSFQLRGFPWWWVRADQIFERIQEVADFLPISQDAPYELMGVQTPAFKEVNLVDDCPVTDQDLLFMYVPLGFAQDVLRWREQYGDALPKGVWENDGTHWSNEGGSREAFASRYVGPMWWVVYPPQQEE